MIVVTGANGQLAKCLELANKKVNQDLLFATKAELDITSERSVSDFFNKHSPSGIINCAAYTAVDKAEDEEELAFNINAKGPGILAKVCRAKKIPMIHFSTDYVFDGEKKSPYLESDECHPLNAYGRTKRAGEVALLNADLHGAIIRTSWLYSEFAPNFLTTMKRLAATHPEVQVVGDQYGSPTYAGELARYTLAHLQKLFSQKMDLYHFSNSGECTWFDFASKILEDDLIKVHRISSDQWPCKAKRSPYSVLNCSKLSSLTGEAPLSWQEGLKECQNQLS